MCNFLFTLVKHFNSIDFVYLNCLFLRKIENCGGILIFWGEVANNTNIFSVQFPDKNVKRLLLPTQKKQGWDFFRHFSTIEKSCRKGNRFTIWCGVIGNIWLTSNSNHFLKISITFTKLDIEFLRQFSWNLDSCWCLINFRKRKCFNLFWKLYCSTYITIPWQECETTFTSPNKRKATANLLQWKFLGK